LYGFCLYFGEGLWAAEKNVYCVEVGWNVL
jgi:hypothetical protein